MKLLIKLFLLSLILFSSGIYAKASDKDAPIHIEADQLEIRDRDGISVYTGNVKITRGSLKITGDKITIKNKDNHLDNIRIKGKPATFYQLSELGEEITAESYFMNYQEVSGMLVLKEKALLMKNKNRFSSEHIIYDTLKDIIKAGKKNTSGSAEPPRVQITIHPKNNKQPE